MAAMMSKGDTSGFSSRSLSLGFNLGFVIGQSSPLLA
jgi:hypothetical protein